MKNQLKVLYNKPNFPFLKILLKLIKIPEDKIDSMLKSVWIPQR